MKSANASQDANYGDDIKAADVDYNSSKAAGLSLGKTGLQKPRLEIGTSRRIESRRVENIPSLVLDGSKPSIRVESGIADPTLNPYDQLGFEHASKSRAHDELIEYLSRKGLTSEALHDSEAFIEKLINDPKGYWDPKKSIQSLTKRVTDDMSDQCTHTNMYPRMPVEIVDEKTGEPTEKWIGDDLPARIFIEDDQCLKIYGSLVAAAVRGTYYSLQEVCRQGDPIHPFLDLDSSTDPITDDQIKQIIEACTRLIQQWCQNAPPVIMPVILRNQSDPQRKVHVHFPDLVLIKEQWKYISEEVKRELPTLSHFIDSNYSGLRLPLCKKKDNVSNMYYDPQYQILDPQCVMRQLMLLVRTRIRAWPGEMPLEIRPEHKDRFSSQKEEYRESEEVTTEIQEAMVKHIDHSQFEARWHGREYLLRRTRPGQCVVCHREHESDNAMIILQGEWIVYKCRRDMKKCHQLEKFRHFSPDEIQQRRQFVRNKLLNEITYRPPSFVHYSKYENCRNQPLIVPIAPTPPIEADLKRRYPRVELPPIDPAVKIQVVWSPMDTGKTYQLIRYLRMVLQSRSIQSFAFLSTRIKFARSLHSKLKKHLADLCTVGSYLDKSKSCAYDPCLVISTESLSKSVKHMDLVILDEVTSCLVQMDSGLHDRNLPHNQARLINMIHNAKYIVAMDADIDHRAVDFLHEVRPDDTIHLSHNTVKKRLGWKCYLRMHKVDWYIKIQEALARGQNIVCPVASSEEGDLIHRWVTERCGIPEDAVRFYRQSGDDYAEELEDVETHWRRFQVLIYTSTINVGIDFSEEAHAIKHYDVMFVYTSTRSNTVREIKQMMGRVRNIKTQVVYHCQSQGGYRGWVPTTTEDIYRSIEQRLNYQNQELDRQEARLAPILLDRKKDREMLRAFYGEKELHNDPRGDVIFGIKNSPFSRLRLANMLEINRSYMHSEELLELTMENQGFECVSPPEKPVHLNLMADFTAWCKATREEEQSAILARMDQILREQNQMTEKQLLAIDQRNQLLIQNGQATETDKLTARAQKFRDQMRADCRSKVTANQIQITEKHLHSLRVHTQYTPEDALLNDLHNLDRGVTDSVDLVRRTVVQEMGQLLGVQDVMTDRTSLVKCQHLRDRLPDWVALCPKLISAYKLRTQHPPKNYRGVKDVLDQVLEAVGRLELQIVNRARHRVNGRQEWRYTYKLKAPPEIDQTIEQIDRRPPINKYVDRREIIDRMSTGLI